MAATDYEKYIRTDELLLLQKPREVRAHPDELLFQVIHQTFELWFKTSLDAVDEIAAEVEAVTAMDVQSLARQLFRPEAIALTVLGNAGLKAGDFDRSRQLLARVNLILQVLTEQLAVLETMNPIDYHTIRLALGRGSGQDSPGFNAMLRIGEPLWEAFEVAQKQTGVSLMDLHQTPKRHADLFRTMQGFMELDERFVRWRFCHFQLVRRMIGEDVKSLKGIPAAQLIHGMREYLFPELWQVINDVTRATKTSY